MKDTNDVIEVVSAGVPLPETESEDTPTPPVAPQHHIKAGYMVTLLNNDQIKTKILGENPGLIELIGLHAAAGEEIGLLKTNNLQGSLAQLNSKLDTIIKLLSNLKPHQVPGPR